MPNHIKMRIDVLYDDFLTKPSDVAGEVLSGSLRLNERTLSLDNGDGCTVIKIRVKRLSRRMLRILSTLMENECQIRFESRRGWLKFGGSPYMRLHISVLDAPPAIRTATSRAYISDNESFFTETMAVAKKHSEEPNNTSQEARSQNETTTSVQITEVTPKKVEANHSSSLNEPSLEAVNSDIESESDAAEAIALWNDTQHTTDTMPTNGFEKGSNIQHGEKRQVQISIDTHSPTEIVKCSKKESEEQREESLDEAARSDRKEDVIAKEPIEKCAGQLSVDNSKVDNETIEVEQRIVSPRDVALQMIVSVLTDRIAKGGIDARHINAKPHKAATNISGPPNDREHDEQDPTEKRMINYMLTIDKDYKRGPSDYYQDHYINCHSLAIRLETFRTEPEADRTLNELDASTLCFTMSDLEPTNCTWSIDGLIRHPYSNNRVRNDLAELLRLGYAACFDLELLVNEPTRYSYGPTYTIIAVPTLEKRKALGGTELVPSERFPKKKACLIHDKIVDLCKKGILSPYNALPIELVALGATRQEIGEYTGWSNDETEDRIASAYGALGVRSKRALARELGISISRPVNKSRADASALKSRRTELQTKSSSGLLRHDSVTFTFELAGTAHHRKGANQLTDGHIEALSARREPNNEYDDNAIAIRVNGYKAGYVPKDDAKELAELMDAGYIIEFTNVLTSYCYKRRKRKINLGYGEYFYEYEEDYRHPIPTATISLVCKKPVSSIPTTNHEAMRDKGYSSRLSGSDTQQNGIHFVSIGDFIVRSHGYSCSHKGHEMTPVEASVTVLVANSLLVEQKFRAFYCEQCGMYYVTDTAFERITRGGKLCCRVVTMEEIFNSKSGDGRFADYAPESLIHQYGYNVSKNDGLTSASRQAILSFIIENDIMTLYEIVSFLEGLIRTRSGMQNMDEAISKWQEDVTFLEHYQPPRRSLKVSTIYARQSMLDS